MREEFTARYDKASGRWTNPTYRSDADPVDHFADRAAWQAANPGARSGPILAPYGTQPDGTIVYAITDCLNWGSAGPPMVTP